MAIVLSFMNKGYQGIYDIYERSLIPIKAKRNRKLDTEFKKYNREINKRKIGVEHVFGILKTFKILLECYSNIEVRDWIEIQFDC